MKKRPNIIIVIADDLGYGDLSCHGNPYVQTPHIDEFMASNAGFSFFQVSPTCAPTRASLLTGRHEFRCGVSHVKMGRSILNADNHTMAEVFAEAGYRTGIFGKWHLGANYPSRPQDRGFERTFYFNGSHLGSSIDYWHNSKFDPVILDEGVFKKQRGYSTDVFFDTALDWIEGQREKPFFAYVATCVPHHPFTAPPDLAQEYRDLGLDEDVANFYGMITKLDDTFGRFIAALKQRGRYDDTIVIFMSDNGSVFPDVYNAGMRGGKANTYEGGTRVPAAIKLPGSSEYRGEYEFLVGAKDIFPTLLELCDLPAKAEYNLEGSSIVPMLENPAGVPERSIIAHLGFWYAPEDVEKSKFLRCSVRSQDFRLVNEAEIHNVFSNPRTEVKYLSEKNWQLFDIKNDLMQERDLRPSNPLKSMEMQSLYDSWWDSISDGLQVPVYITVGNSAEPVTRLSFYDWYHDDDSPARRECSVAMPRTVEAVLDYLNHGKESEIVHDNLTGAWNINVEAAGEYRVVLSILPPEAGSSVRLRKGRAILRFRDCRREMTITEDDAEIAFVLPLPAGKGELRCALEGQLPGGNPLGAFFVHIQRLG